MKYTREYNFKPDMAKDILVHSIRRNKHENFPNSTLVVPITDNPTSYIAAHVIGNITTVTCKLVYLILGNENSDMNAMLKDLNEKFDDVDVIDACDECREYVNLMNCINCNNALDTLRVQTAVRDSYLLSMYTESNPIIIDSMDKFSGSLIPNQGFSFRIFNDLYYDEILKIGKLEEFDINSKLIDDLYKSSYQVRMVEDYIHQSLITTGKEMRNDVIGKESRTKLLDILYENDKTRKFKNQVIFSNNLNVIYDFKAED